MKTPTIFGCFLAVGLMMWNVGFAADLPPGQSTPTSTNELDKLAGQPVDIAPWTYAWRADRTIQEKPEAYFIPHRLERIDKVYRTACQPRCRRRT